MLVPDVNILMNAENRSFPAHDAARRWLLSAGNGQEPLALPAMVLFGYVRIATGSGMKENRMSLREAFEFCDVLYSMPSYSNLKEGSEHWRIFRELVAVAGVSGPDITDAYLAAFAIENDATFVTFDRGFMRFPGLKLLDLSP